MQKHLLPLFKCGEEKRDVFVSECSSTSEQFIEPIYKTTITTFASESFKRKNKSKKVAELQVTKGTKAIDLESVFSFSILPEPACFAYPDGTIRQNDKLTVFHQLTKDFQSNPPGTIETAIANGMFILNLSN